PPPPPALSRAAPAGGTPESAPRPPTPPAARGGPLDARGKTLVGENAIELSACRATLSRAGRLIDECLGPDCDVVALFAEAQAAKAFVNDAAARVVDRALALSGGVGYLNGHPLARAYRDVKAGAFIHPPGANRAYEFLADVSLGREPVVS